MRLLACLIVAPQRGYDEPAILSYAISSFCPTSADGLQWGAAECASIAAFWHDPEVPPRLAHVGYWGKIGKDLLVLSFAGFDLEMPHCSDLLAHHGVLSSGWQHGGVASPHLDSEQSGLPQGS